MAKIFTTGTINQPDAGSVGLAMVEKMRDDITAHAAWDLVEEFTPASGACRWYVLKCLASESGLPSDFYVVIGRTLGNGELRVFICEEYIPASHMAHYYAPCGYSSQYQYDASGRILYDFALGQTILNTSTDSRWPDYRVWVPSGTSTKWWIIVDNDQFAVAFNGASNGYYHVGAYTPLAQLPIDMPIQLSGYSGGSNSALSLLTRNPGAADLMTYGMALSCQGMNGNQGPSPSYMLGFNGDLRYNDKLQNGQRSVAEFGMFVSNYQQGDSAVYGWALGKQKGIRGTWNNVPAGLAFGDAYVLDGTLWVPYNPFEGRIWDTGVASS